MNINKKLARIYTNALVGSLNTKERLLAAQTKIDQVDLLFRNIPDLKKLFFSPIAPKKIKTELLSLLFAEDQTLRKFFLLLLAKGRLNILTELKDNFDQELAQRLNQQSANIFSAKALDPAVLLKLKTALSAYFKKEIVSSVHIDNSLFGGIRIESGNYVLDNTVKKRLSRVSAAFA
ncbi:MAG: ATP synthase F1 subunit delta [Candidatus Margulisiibacteriota bacterium]|jgi:F-type H+-transporting ATPase subunit delta